MVSTFRVFGGCAFAAPDDFAVDDLAGDGFEPNDSAPALAFALLVAGGLWPAAGAATSADARRKRAIDDCNALARREGRHDATRCIRAASHGVYGLS